MEGWLVYLLSFLIISMLGRWIINVSFYNLLYYFFIQKLIASDYEINSHFAIFIFCSTFSLSVISLEMVIFDVFGIGSEEGRKTKWKLTLTLLVFICIYLIPLILILKIVNKIGYGLKSKLCTHSLSIIFISLLCYLYLCLYLVSYAILNYRINVESHHLNRFHQ